jgi:short subunit dehydrogenase-like uncharacterized protein
MTEPEWMIYGATGYTGQLVAEQAVRRGRTPLLAGRSEHKLARLGSRLGLPWQTARLDDLGALLKAHQNIRLVFHAAGPFSQTLKPVIEACLASRSHYIDINGEVPAFEAGFSYHKAALEKGVSLVLGAGLDVVPSDCLAVYTAHKLPGAAELLIGINALGSASGGTLKSSLEMIAAGGLVRRAGRLLPHRLGEGQRLVHFPGFERWAIPIPWGDLSTAYRSTDIPSITTYKTFPRRTIALVRRWGPLLGAVLKVKPLRRLFQRLLSGRSGPTESERAAGRSHFWVKASRQDGQHAQAWLEAGEGYSLTAEAGLLAVERVLAGVQPGALSPAQAFGPEFILEMEGTRRWDSLD